MGTSRVLIRAFQATSAATHCGEATNAFSSSGKCKCMPQFAMSKRSYNLGRLPMWSAIPWSQSHDSPAFQAAAQKCSKDAAILFSPGGY